MSEPSIAARVTACSLTQPGYNGVRYCHEHSSWQEPWQADRDHCPQAIALRNAIESETSA